MAKETLTSFEVFVGRGVGREVGMVGSADSKRSYTEDISSSGGLSATFSSGTTVTPSGTVPTTTLFDRLALLTCCVGSATKTFEEKFCGNLDWFE